MTELILRHPTVADSKAMYDLIDHTPGLDTNSHYQYALWCRDFASRCAVAFENDKLVGVLTGYVRPDRPDTYFAWQTAISVNSTNSDIAQEMYDFVARSFSNDGINRIEMSVDEDNRAVRFLLSRLRRHYDATITSETLFTAEDLGGDHYPETLKTLHLPSSSLNAVPGASSVSSQ